MKSRKEQLEIELAFENGAKIESKLLDYNDDKFIVIRQPEFDWDIYNYRIKEEPKRVPFDGSDVFNLLGQKFKHEKDEDKFDTSICTRADSLGVYLDGVFISYFELAQYWLKWNDLLKVWEECSKIK